MKQGGPELRQPILDRLSNIRRRYYFHLGAAVFLATLNVVKYHERPLWLLLGVLACMPMAFISYMLIKIVAEVEGGLATQMSESAPPAPGKDTRLAIASIQRERGLHPWGMIAVLIGFFALCAISFSGVSEIGAARSAGYKQSQRYIDLLGDRERIVKANNGLIQDMRRPYYPGSASILGACLIMLPFPPAALAYYRVLRKLEAQAQAPETVVKEKTGPQSAEGEQ